ncbi:solute carrier family 23 protein [Micropruina sp.]|uniref:solute carrier family 23 protein n=1 Tax=Micropruina sp. TaxID=2737536 RepID=UPI0039E5162F
MATDTVHASEVTKARVHPVDEVLPAPRLAAYGFQHVLAFYAGAVLVPILVSSALGLTSEQLIHLINADLFTCGIASILQAVGFGRGAWRVGIKLPLLQGVTFTAVSPMIAIGMAVIGTGGTPVDGLLTIYGAVIVAGLFTFFVAPFFAKLLRFFPPVVTGSIILIIGVALVPVAAGDISFGAIGGLNGVVIDATGAYTPVEMFDYSLRNPELMLKNLAYAGGTLALILVVQRFTRGFLQTIAVLLGLVAGTLVAFFLGDAHFDDVASSSWIGVTTPFYFGVPQFSITAILSMIIVMLITMVETTGDAYATGEIVGKRVRPSDISAAIRADGLATTLGGVLNSFPYTAFAENVGLVRLTQVKSRWVVVAAGSIMIILGLLPKAAAIVAGIPHPVLGGAALALFAAVAVAGIQTLQKVDFTDHRNGIVVGTTIGAAGLITGYGAIAGAFPGWAQIFFGSGITLGAIVAIGLNLLFFHTGGGHGQAVAGRPGVSLVTIEQTNTMTRDAFADTFGDLVQGAPWAVDAAFAARPFEDAYALRAAFQDALLGATEEQQLELLRSFPDLGSLQDTAHARYADDHSVKGLPELAGEDLDDLNELTTAFEQKFGFPLVVSAADVDRYEKVIAHGWTRLANSPAAEKAAGLLEVAKILNHRFNEKVADANPIAAAKAAIAAEYGH